MNLLKPLTLTVTLTVFSPATPAVVNTGLIAYWPLNGDAQEVLQKYPGTAIAMIFTSAPEGEVEPWYEMVPADFQGDYPRWTKVAIFNGKTSYIEVTDSSTSPLRLTKTPYTLSAWIFWEGEADRTYTVLSKVSTYDNSGWRLFLQGVGNQEDRKQGKLTYCTQPSACLTYPPDSTASWPQTTWLLSQRWYNVIITYDPKPPTKATLYLDGQPVASTPLLAPFAPTPYTFVNLLMGKQNTTGDYFQGRLDDVRLYNRVLTLAELDELSHGCATANYDVKRGKVAIPCIVVDEVSGGWQATLTKIPGATTSGFLDVTVESSKSLLASEFLWGSSIAVYLPREEKLVLPAVTVASPFGLPATDCLAFYFDYSLPNIRFLFDSAFFQGMACE